MNKAIMVVLAILACFLPIASVAGDSRTPGDDLVETTFYGTVTDSETGEPLQDAYVWAWTGDYNNYQGGWTDKNGEYYIEFNLGGDFIIVAGKEDYEEIRETASVRVNDKTQMDFELDPIHYASKIFGTVTDADSGTPLSNVAIYLYNTTDDGSWSYAKQYQTGSDGKYSFEVNDGTYGLDFNKRGYENYVKEKIVIAGEDLQLDVQMQRYQQGVFGVVTDENGDPMEGVGVVLENNDFRLYNVTDKDGKFEIRTPVPGDYTLSVSANGHRPAFHKISISEGEIVEDDFQMQKAYLPDPILRFVYRILLLLGLVG